METTIFIILKNFNYILILLNLKFYSSHNFNIFLIYKKLEITRFLLNVNN